jgi:hypothetical protein
MVDDAKVCYRYAGGTSIVVIERTQFQMARFLISLPHTPEDCVPELDSILGHSKELLSRFDWACKVGEHVGWVVVEAADERTARTLLPAALRARANAQQLNKFSEEDIHSFHASA